MPVLIHVKNMLSRYIQAWVIDFSIEFLALACETIDIPF